MELLVLTRHTRARRSVIHMITTGRDRIRTYTAPDVNVVVVKRMTDIDWPIATKRSRMRNCELFVYD